MAGNTTATGMAQVLESSLSMIEVAQDKFAKSVSSNPSAIQASSTIMMGNTVLNGADALLRASITESMIAIVNSDEYLSYSSEDYNRLVQRLYDIPDWFDDKGKWSVSMMASSFAPHLQLTIDAETLVASVPSITFDASSAKSLIEKMNAFDQSTRKLLNHNALVLNALSQYTPYMAGEASVLRSILAAAGLLNAFCGTMSFIALAEDLGVTVEEGQQDLLPSVERCKDAYPDLFDAEAQINAIYAAKRKRQADLAAPHASDSVQDSIESNVDKLGGYTEELKNYKPEIKDIDLVGATSSDQA
jgi:hypothetical protein